MSSVTRAAMQKLVTMFESTDYTWVLQREHSVVHKNQISYLECNKPVITHSRETLIVPDDKPGFSVVFHKSSTPATKTFYYSYILANKLISVHWLQGTQFSY